MKTLIRCIGLDAGLLLYKDRVVLPTSRTTFRPTRIGMHLTILPRLLGLVLESTSLPRPLTLRILGIR